MKILLTAVRVLARLINTLCVLVLLAVLLPTLLLDVTCLIQNTDDPLIGKYTLSCVETDDYAPRVCRGALVLAQPQTTYPRYAEVVFYADGLRSVGEVTGMHNGCCLLADADGNAFAGEVPTDRILGRAVCRIPRLGGWVAWARDADHLPLLLGAGVLLVELPQLSRLRRKKKQSS